MLHLIYPKQIVLLHENHYEDSKQPNQWSILTMQNAKLISLVLLDCLQSQSDTFYVLYIFMIKSLLSL